MALATHGARKGYKILRKCADSKQFLILVGTTNCICPFKYLNALDLPFALWGIFYPFVVGNQTIHNSRQLDATWLVHQPAQHRFCPCFGSILRCSAYFVVHAPAIPWPIPVNVARVVPGVPLR